MGRQMPEGLDRIGLHLPTFLAYVANFLMLLGALYLVAYRPLLRSLRVRRERIRQAIEDAEEAKRSRAQVAQEREAILQAASKEAQAIQQRAAGEMGEARKRGKEEAQAYLQKARQQALAERRQAFEEALRAAGDLVMLASEKALGHAIDRQAHAALIAAAVQEVASHPLELGGAGPPTLGFVGTAVPLTEPEWAEVQKAVCGAAGRPITVVRRVEPGLLGGLTVTIGDTVIDASVLGRLRRLQRHLRDAAGTLDS